MGTFFWSGVTGLVGLVLGWIIGWVYGKYLRP
jgi:hypothetical protein